MNRQPTFDERFAGWPPDLVRIQNEIVQCDRCPRLREYCREIAGVKRRAYRDQQYWGRPVPSFGDPRARLLIVGLAPGAHGANRTGRMFTGDSSGELLYRTLFETGFASQPQSTDLADGLQLTDAYISAPVHCAPPANKPSKKEFQNCSCFLEREMIALHHIQVVVVLGRLARDAYLGALIKQGKIHATAAYPFGHGAVYDLPNAGVKLMCCYHPSRQNTQTGRLTGDMFRGVFEQARAIIH